MNKLLSPEERAAAVRHSLQRPVGQDYLDEWARHLRQPVSETVLRDRSGLVFRIGAEWLLLPTAMVDAIAPSAPVHTLPHRRGGALTGIVNVGGAIVPALSLSTLLGIEEGAAGSAAKRHVFARLLVLRADSQRFAVPVADLHGIVRYGGHEVQAPAATINRGMERYLAGVLAQGELLVGVLQADLVGQQMTRLLR